MGNRIERGSCRTFFFFGLILLSAFEASELLLGRGADPNAKDNSGRTLLHLAEELGRLGVVQRLLGLDVDVNPRDSRGLTPLAVAPLTGEDMIQLLLEHGADPNVENHNGYSLLHVALEQRNLNVAHQLQSFGADINTHYKHGRTYLHKLVAGMKQDVAELFVKLKVAQALLKVGSGFGVCDIEGGHQSR